MRLPPITDPAPRILLDGIVDYAGLFPPASLALPDAVRTYAQARGGEAGWMLGRFICPATRLSEFSEVAEPLLPRDVGAIPWRLAAVGSGDHEADAAAVAALNSSHRWGWDECNAVADVVETRARDADEVLRVHQAFTAETVVYVECPLADDPTPMVQALSQCGRRAKMRLGGVTASAFPAPEQVIRFMHVCLHEGVPFKATAGLHHPIGGRYPLTYAADAPEGTMYGYLNLFTAAALLLAHAPEALATAALTDTDPDAMDFSDAALTWRGHVIDQRQLAHLREHIAVSFGSCSFAEPVDEIRAMEAW